MKHSFEYTMVEQCAPTLAGLKPASLFRFVADERKYLCDKIVYWDRILRFWGVRVRIVKACLHTNAFLVYLYREQTIGQLLTDSAVQDFLMQSGYSSGGSEELIRQLAKRLCVNQDFPHEIGVFLGYPLEDVEGFIANKGENYTCCGCWKVYGDPTAAQERFARYRKCTTVYQRLFERGTPITRLTVAV